MKENVSFEEFEAASATGCTGLMANAPQNEYEYEAYFDIMTFSPKEICTAENKPADKKE